MSACASLLELYSDWRKLTEAECEAIREGNWRQVKRCQGAKSQLQPRILKQTEEARREREREGIDSKTFDKQVRSLVNELIYLESRNGEFLAEQKRLADEEWAAVERSGRTLTKIHKSYTAGTAVAWESYS